MFERYYLLCFYKKTCCLSLVRQLLDRRKQSELEKIFEDNFLSKGHLGSSGDDLLRGPATAASSEDQPRKLPGFLRARSRHPVTAAQAQAPSQMKAISSGTAGQQHVSLTQRGASAPTDGSSWPAADAASGAPSGSSSSSVVLPDLPVPYWTSGRNARLGNKDLQEQARRHEEATMMKRQPLAAFPDQRLPPDRGEAMGLQPLDAEPIPPSGIPLPSRSPPPREGSASHPTVGGPGGGFSAMTSEDTPDEVKAAAAYFQMKAQQVRKTVMRSLF